MANYSDQFFTQAAEILAQVARESGEAIQQAAAATAEAIVNDGLLILFGSGHSALVARDAVERAGGLLPAMAIHDVAEGDGERLEGMAAVIANRYPLEAGSVLVVISNSGINPVPIEMVMLGKEKGLTTVALTALSHSRAVNSRHSSGRKLYEVADIVIDTHGIRGDAIVQVPGVPYRTGGASTLVGCAIVQAITVQTAALLAERGHTVPIIVSDNVPESDEQDYTLRRRYLPRLVRYQIPPR
jgi:uncharacterized phosphosugar-binding protein